MSSEKQRWLTFSLCEEQYGIPLMKVREVIALADTTPVPQMPPHFRGIMNLRGRIVSVIDLRTRFRLTSDTEPPESAIVILDVGAGDLGVVVDSVDSVLAVTQDDVSAPPQLGRRDGQEYITGVSRKDQRLVLLLDIEKALGVSDLKLLNKEPDASKAA